LPRSAFQRRSRVEANAPPVPFDRARFEQYIGLFDKGDPAVMAFWADDVVMHLGPHTIETPRGIYEHFTNLHESMTESNRVLFFVSDDRWMAVKLRGEMTAVRDFEMLGTQVKRGMVQRIEGVVLYELAKGRIRGIDCQPVTELNHWEYVEQRTTQQGTDRQTDVKDGSWS
jgi:hypothetical protein